ncbi:hypothetical protein HQ489_05080 [Candidatus Woesearchaeota archaeon]|nr:hypothetical protein [Candidatus Woesearchaeota archaeon]
MENKNNYCERRGFTIVKKAPSGTPYVSLNEITNDAFDSEVTLYLCNHGKNPYPKALHPTLRNCPKDLIQDSLEAMISDSREIIDSFQPEGPIAIYISDPAWNDIAEDFVKKYKNV